MSVGRRRLGAGFAALLVCVLAATVGAANAQATTYSQATSVVGGLPDLWDLYMNPSGWTLGTTDEAYAVNGVGRLVGGYQNASGHERAFLWDGSTFKDLGTLGGKQAVATANVPFGNDLYNGFNCRPLCSVLMDGVASSNAHGQLLVATDDQEGNDDSTGMLLTPIQIYDGSSPTITWSAGWATVSSKRAWGGGVDLAKTAGATMTFSFTGKSVSVIAPTGPGLASATVTVDGVNPTTVDENTTSGQRQRVFRATFPTVGQHTLQIVAGTGFQVDALTTTQY